MFQGRQRLSNIFEIVHLLPRPLCVSLTHVLNRLLGDALNGLLSILLSIVVSEVFG